MADMKWIPVTERLPKDNTQCLVTKPSVIKGGGWTTYIAWYDREFGFHEYDAEWGDIPVSNVTHTLDKWNNAKKAEERDRVKHGLGVNKDGHNG